MKRILTLILVGILLLPSLFACGNEPQATTTAPAKSDPLEVPVLVVGKSGNSGGVFADMSLSVQSYAWTEEEAWFELTYSTLEPYSTKRYRSYTRSFSIEREVNGTWESFVEYETPENYNPVETYRIDEQGDYHRVHCVTDSFGRFENGNYRFVKETKLYENRVLTERGSTWFEFTVLWMSPKAEDEKRKPIDFTAHYVRTGYVSDEGRTAALTVFHSRAKLEAYYEKNKRRAGFPKSYGSYGEAMPSFLGLMDRYDEAYFEDRVLIMLERDEGSGSFRHVTDFVEEGPEGKLFIGMHTVAPFVSSDDMANWHILIELPKGVSVESEADVTLFWDGKKKIHPFALPS